MGLSHEGDVDHALLYCTVIPVVSMMAHHAAHPSSFHTIILGEMSMGKNWKTGVSRMIRKMLKGMAYDVGIAIEESKRGVKPSDSAQDAPRDWVVGINPLGTNEEKKTLLMKRGGPLFPRQGSIWTFL